MASKPNRSYVTREELTERVRLVVAEHGGQSAVAATLGVTQPAVAQAVRGAAGMDKLQRRILEELGGYEVRAVYELVEPAGRKKTARTT